MTDPTIPDAIVVFCTAASLDEARRIARTLLEARLIACAGLVSGVESHYRWQGAIEQSNEVLLVIKTRRMHFDALERTILEHHSYDVPEIIAVPIATGHEPYLQWLADCVAGKEAGG